MTRNMAIRKAESMAEETGWIVVVYRALDSMKGLRPHQRFNAVFYRLEAHEAMKDRIQEIAWVFPKKALPDIKTVYQLIHTAMESEGWKASWR